MPDPKDELTPLEENEETEEYFGEPEEEEEQSGEEEQSDPNEELTNLKEQVEKLQGLDNLAADLRRSVGRIQALESKLQSVESATDNSEILDQINKQFGGVHELLSTVVENIDDTALDPATKARVREAYESSRRASERASLRNEATNEALETLKKQYPQLFEEKSSTQNQAAIDPELIQKAHQIEESVLALFEDRELDPDDPQFKTLWAEGANLIQNGKSGAEVRAHFREKLNDHTSEETAADRRQAAKSKAGRGSPAPAGPTGDPADRLSKAKNLDEGVELLRQMGVSV